jgi:23S rRNA (cytosine1962-C5)-methyltransferase
VAAVRERLGPVAVIERSDAPVRLLEGLPEPVHFADAEAPQAMTIRENGLLMRARFGTGHKTGHYHDQRDNRAAAAAYARGLSVMDAFCNTGGFGLCALAAGAASVEFVDSSAEALDALRENLALNGLGERASTVSANVFDHLREAERAKRRYGMIVLDPPAFAKGRDAVEGAWRGYKDINYRAIGLLERGGWLVSCSCSQHFGPDLFLSMLREAAKDAERSLLIAETRYQAKDHPVLAGYPESLYLKCVIAQVR